MKISARKSRPQPAWHQSGLLFAVCIAVAVWFADQTLGLHALRNSAFDRAMQVRTSFSQPESSVILVLNDASFPPRFEEAATESPFGTASNDIAINDRITESLEQDGIVATVFTCAATELSPALIDRVRYCDGVFLAQRASQQLRQTGFSARPVENQFVDTLPIGLLQLPYSNDGVQRNQQRNYSSGHRMLPSMECQVAGSLSPIPADNVGNTFSIHFRGGAGSLPTVRASDLLAGHLLPEMLIGRVAIVCSPEELRLPGMVVSAGQDGPMLPIEIHGHALNTLLTHSQIVRPIPPLELLILIAAAVITVGMCQQFRLRHALAAGFGLVILEFAIGVSVLWYNCVWLPIGLCAATQLLCLLWIYHARVRFTSQHVREMLLEMNLRVGRRQKIHSEDEWQDVVRLLQQNFPTTECVCVATADDSSKLSVAAATDSDWHKKTLSLDVQQEPFRIAVNSRAVLNLTERNCELSEFASAENGVQYLVPFVRATRTLGFAVLNVRINREEEDRVAQHLSEYARELTDLLENADTQRRHLPPGRRYLTTIPEERDCRILERNAASLEAQLFRLERLFDGSRLPMAVYDIFGRFVVGSSSLGQELQRRSLVAGDLSAAEFLRQFAGCAEDQSRVILRQVIEQAESENIWVTDETSPGQLTVRPLFNDQESDSAGSSHVFGVEGIVFEFLPEEFLRRGTSSGTPENFSHSDRHKIAASPDIDRELRALDEQWNQQAVESVRTVPVGSMETTADAGTTTIAPHRADVWVAVIGEFESARESLQNRCRERRIKIEFEPEISADNLDALTSPLTDNEFHILLECLLEDARDRSAITMQLRRDATGIQLELKNDGFGMTNTQLEQRISAAHSGDAFGQLASVIACVESARGTIQIVPEIGRGLNVLISIPG